MSGDYTKNTIGPRCHAATNFVKKVVFSLPIHRERYTPQQFNKSRLM